MANAASGPENDDLVEDGPKTEAASRTDGPTFAAPEADVQDLGAELAVTVSRNAGETVRCRRIVGNHYRCNWWAARHSTSDGDESVLAALEVTTFRVVRSQMIRVYRTAQGLSIHPEPDQ